MKQLLSLVVISCSLVYAPAVTAEAGTCKDPERPDGRPVDYRVPSTVVDSAAGLRNKNKADKVGDWVGANLRWDHRLASYYAVIFYPSLPKPLYLTTGFCDGSTAHFRYGGIRLGGNRPYLILTYLPEATDP